METNTKGYCRTVVVVAGCLLGLCAWVRAETEAEKEKRRIEAKIITNTEKSFVIIHYHHKKSERPQPAEDDYSNDFEDDEALQKILAKRTTDFAGLIISSKGEVFTRDDYIDPETVEKITITGGDDKSVSAEWDRVLTVAPGRILRISEELPDGWRPLSFSPNPPPLAAETRLFAISLTDSGYSYSPCAACAEKEHTDYSIKEAPPIRSRRSEDGSPYYFSIGENAGATVVCDAEGAVLGVTAHDRIEIGGDAVAWLGRDILSDAGVSRRLMEERIREQFSRYLYEVTITFREPPKEDDEYDMGGMYESNSIGMYGMGEENKELMAYGLAIGPGKLLLPFSVPPKLVAGIDTITVDVGEDKLEGVFAGALKEYEAAVIEVNEPGLADAAKIDPAVTLARAEPFWTVFARELAGKDLVIGYNRWIRKSRGYANKFYPRVENDIRNGSWLIDKTGRLAGLYVNARRGHERILPYLMGEEYAHFSAAEMSFGQIMSGVSARSYHYGHDSETELVMCDVLAPIVANLEAHYDPHIRHLSKDEQKRRVWLGVEYTGLSKEMAKQLNLRKETHDGRIGLMINRVYAGSPAAKMGLVEGDILLKLKVAEGPWPIELMYGAYEDVEGLDYEDMEIPEEYEAMGYQMPRRRPWSSRNNFFTRMLYAIGASVPTTLTYMHEGKQLEQEFTIEQAPRDSLSANKFKDEKLGITVKDLTYEVRAGLKLSADEKGVVVSKVEPGTPTALARINMFELIRAADGRTLGTVEEFEASIRNAKEQGKDSIRLTVEWMGKTRLADLKFQAKGSNLNDMMRLLPRMPGSNEEDEF